MGLQLACRIVAGREEVWLFWMVVTVHLRSDLRAGQRSAFGLPELMTSEVTAAGSHALNAAVGLIQCASSTWTGEVASCAHSSTGAVMCIIPEAVIVTKLHSRGDSTGFQLLDRVTGAVDVREQHKSRRLQMDS